ncbi:cytidine deaminase [Streptomyces huiliensis]|uniref:cytidine deaminase n=1 Tax=Streptomyces huiliensis TaxID=2876027 RepID=UPI001CC0E4FA|nr:cytidine deaminase [Streptomyces huiliensis]MBZ4322283.1 cytidine deaminase [Streptomyces huiliensis]
MAPSPSRIGSDEPIDHELVEAAARVVREHASGDEHTVAAAARTDDGRVATGLNVYHFTGGPCAELVVIGAAAAQGARALTAIVAVGGDERGILPPCGRCRQVLLDYYPAIEVIVEDGRPRSVPVADLLPGAYVNAEHQ